VRRRGHERGELSERFEYSFAQSRARRRFDPRFECLQRLTVFLVHAAPADYPGGGTSLATVRSDNITVRRENGVDNPPPNQYTRTKFQQYRNAVAGPHTSIEAEVSSEDTALNAHLIAGNESG
jgi:hypothetical protein